MSDAALIVKESAELSVDDVRSQVNKIQALMKDIMKKNEHYGVIPGTKKPSLLKAGAEKLGFTFRLVPEFTVTRNDLPRGHREYEVVCTLRHMQTETRVGQGVGNCSSMESKYRWRKNYISEEVGNIPGHYWGVPKDQPDTQKKRDAILVQTFGPGKYNVKKSDGGWKVLKITGDGERTENPDIADVYNTVLKMAKKRAHVDAMITACAASDIFTQDVEDMENPETGKPKPGNKSARKGTTKKNENGAKTGGNDNPEEIIKRLRNSGLSAEEKTKLEKEYYSKPEAARKPFAEGVIAPKLPAEAEEIQADDPGINASFEGAEASTFKPQEEQLPLDNTEAEEPIY